MFQCIDDFCSYHRPDFLHESVDKYWRMTRATARVVDVDQPLSVKECWEWELGYPYLHGDFVCNESMVWMCDWNNENNTNYASVKEGPSRNHQEKALQCRNIEPTYNMQ